MPCPDKFINTRIEAPSGVIIDDFLKNNFINNWSFKDFLLSLDNLNDMDSEMLKSCNRDYASLLESLKTKIKLERRLVTYINELKSEDSSEEDLKKTLHEALIQPQINISNNQGSTILVAGRDGKIVNNDKGKRKLPDEESDSTVNVEKNKKKYSYIKPVTTGITYNFNGPEFDSKSKEDIDKVVFIKLNDSHICEDAEVVSSYNTNINEQISLSCINQHPAVLEFLRDVVKQDLEDLSLWAGLYPIKTGISAAEKNDLVFGKLVIADYWANCVKPVVSVKLNERTPFVEHVVPLFKYFSAVYKNTIGFQWCEKGLETNRFISLYHADESGRRRLSDGVGYSVGVPNEILLIESSGDHDEDHSKEDTMKLLECSIRSLKAEAEKMKFASLETFKKRRFFSCLYSKDKLTMVSTFLVDKNRWGFVFVREAIIPRSWECRYDWLKVFELMYCLKNHLEKQQKISEKLMEEAGGWVTVEAGKSLNDFLNK